MSKLLKAAIESLQINDVYLFKTNSWLRDDFDPKYLTDPRTIIIQHKHAVQKAEVLDLIEEIDTDEKNEFKIFKVFIELGSRWTANNTQGEESKNDQDPDVSAQIEATYVAEYKINKQVEQDALDEFALKNASFHVWPFWREFLMSQCARMNLPKVALPTLQLAKNHK
ncbi:MAG: preprotein translocase subunit SecB [Deltaproteobacteria bacterium]|nr:preprotein translocase subunit SecB [Deltaproteobacteria bacterium]